ncbi:MAG: hypothetical protein OHK0047_02470 [Leptolyngbyaceae cyanobacterium]
MCQVLVVTHQASRLSRNISNYSMCNNYIMHPYLKMMRYAALTHPTEESTEESGVLKSKILSTEILSTEILSTDSLASGENLGLG